MNEDLLDLYFTTGKAIRIYLNYCKQYVNAINYYGERADLERGATY